MNWQGMAPLLFAPFLGWFWGLPGYLRSHRNGDWLEPAWVTWLLVMPFLGWFVAVFLLVGMMTE